MIRGRKKETVEAWELKWEKEVQSWYICSRAAELWDNDIPLVGLEEESIRSCQSAVGTGSREQFASVH